MLVELLRGEGYETVEAKSGSEVLRVVPVEELDLLLIDLRMPDRMILRVQRETPSPPPPSTLAPAPARPVRPAGANRQT